ncbi:MAG: PstS family phosphate ABC transporter substrate-binding protein [Gaiellaceae bacterium]
MRRTFRHSRRAAAALVALAAIAASVTAATSLAGGERLAGRITADGSSTVGPYTSAAAELFQKKESGVQITVGISGTGGGFQRFCNDETDLSNASRPMRLSEAQRCAAKGVRWVAFTIANDGVSIVVNKDNTWVKSACMSTEQLKRIWQPGSKIDNWKEIDSTYPDTKLKLFGPGTDSGTFDFFTAAINGKEKASRSDYSPSENDDVLVQGVAGEKGGLGYFGYSYYVENRDRLRLIAVNAGNGCIAPNVKTIQAYRYKPLSRPLFIYAKLGSFSRPEVRAFIKYVLDNEREIARRSKYVSLTAKQLRKFRYQYGQAVLKARR